MLVFSRRAEEEVVITASNGERIVVRVLQDYHRGKLRLGLVAPETVTIHRGETQRKIDAALEDGKA